MCSTVLDKKFVLFFCSLPGLLLSGQHRRLCKLRFPNPHDGHILPPSVRRVWRRLPILCHVGESLCDCLPISRFLILRFYNKSCSLFVDRTANAIASTLWTRTTSEELRGTVEPSALATRARFVVGRAPCQFTNIVSNPLVRGYKTHWSLSEISRVFFCLQSRISCWFLGERRTSIWIQVKEIWTTKLLGRTEPSALQPIQLYQISQTVWKISGWHQGRTDISTFVVGTICSTQDVSYNSFLHISAYYYLV